MQRLRYNDDIIYFFPLKAFKFPGPSEVFFYCSVDISPGFDFPKTCNETSRKLRSIRPANDQWVELYLSKNVTIQAPLVNDVQRVDGVAEDLNGSTLIGGLLAVLALGVAITTAVVFFACKR
jgi:hypothetical protein